MTSQSEDLRLRIREAIRAQTKTNVNVLSSLHAVLDEIGYIPDEAVEEVANSSHVTINEVWGVASFYTNFRFRPPAANSVEICWGPTCHLLGAQQIVKAVFDDLGLEGEGDTEDNRASVKLNTCLGACSQAPVIMINHRIIGQASVESARSHLSALPTSGH